MSKENNPPAEISDLNGNLEQIEKELIEMQAILNKEWRAARGTQKVELKNALDALNPVVEGFKETRYTIEDKYGLEKLKSYIKPQIDKLTKYLEKPISVVKNNEILNAVKDVLVSTYDFVESAIIATLDNAIKTGEFAKSIVDLGQTLATGKGPVSSEVQTEDPPIVGTMPTTEENIQIIGKGFEEAKKLLSGAFVAEDIKSEQKKQLVGFIGELDSVMRSLNGVGEANKRDAAYSQTYLGKLQNWVEEQMNSVANNKYVQKVTHNPSLNATMNVVTTGGSLLKTTVNNALDRAIKAGKVAESIVKVGVAVSNTVGRAAGVNKASPAR